jgi:hypothetical protein
MAFAWVGRVTLCAPPERVNRRAEDCPPYLGDALRLVTETLLMATLLHALAALVFRNFRFAPFFERAHSGFQFREPGFNHLIRLVATQFFAALPSILTRGAFERHGAGTCWL